jgi:hypothetical protein
MVQFVRLAPPQNFGSDLGQAIGQGISTGAQYGLQHQYQQVKDEQKLQKNISSLQRVLADNPEADFGNLAKAILTTQGMDRDFQQAAIGTLGKAEQIRQKERQLNEPTAFQKNYLQQQQANYDLRNKDFALRFQKFQDAPKNQRLKTTQDYFNDQIKTLQTLLNKKDLTKTKEQFDAVQKQIKDLGRKKERVSQKILKGEPVDLEDYGLGEEELEQPTVGQTSPQGNQVGMGVVQEATKKPKFDAANPEHRAVAQKLYNQFQDKEKVRQALAKEFEI